MRWCICAAAQPIVCPLQIALLTHKRELFRPSSTGNLIRRLFPASSQHVWHQERPLTNELVVTSGREVWILHPGGSPAPAGADPTAIQAILLDGSWSETASMARKVASWGRCVSLPLAGESRFLLRAKQEGRRYSTAEALMFLLENLGLQMARAALAVQLDLHVYAGLRARGNLQAANEFLAGTSLLAEMPEIMAALVARRPVENDAVGKSQEEGETAGK
jgi:DTW domain-containing protein YfiP